MDLGNFSNFCSTGIRTRDHVGHENLHFRDGCHGNHNGSDCPHHLRPLVSQTHLMDRFRFLTLLRESGHSNESKSIDAVFHQVSLLRFGVRHPLPAAADGRPFQTVLQHVR